MRTLLIIFGILIASSTLFANHKKQICKPGRTHIVVASKAKPVKHKVWVPGHWVKTKKGTAWMAGHWKRV